MDNKPVFDMVLFGGTGDLVMRKLLPSLYQAHAAGLLNPNGRLWALGRKDLGRDAYLQQVEAEARIHIKHAFDVAQWQSFCRRTRCLPNDEYRYRPAAAYCGKGGH